MTFKTFQKINICLLFCLIAHTNQAQNKNYIANKAPLIKTPFISLPLGSIEPQGWLAVQLQLQKSGMTGNSETIYKELGNDAGWLGGNAPDSDWERPPYYVKGLISLAYSLNDSELKIKAQKWIDWTLNSQLKDGSFGPKSNDDWWPRMPMLTALMDYCEATNDARVIPFLTNYFHYQSTALKYRPLIEWGKARGADNVDVIIWLYNRTGESFLLDLIDEFKKQTYDFTAIFNSNAFITDFNDNFYPMHNVNVAQAYKYGPVFYQRTNNKSDKQAFKNGMQNLKNYHTQITDMNPGTEMLSGTASTQGVELCGTVERMASDELASRILAEAWIGDELEKIAFNQLPAALSGGMHQHQYYTLPNQVQSKKGSNGFSQNYDNGVVPGPFSGYPCCRFNWHMGWPKYSQYSWMATQDGGLAIAAYAPSKVTAKVANNQDVIITESTNYPFDEKIKLTINIKKPTSFPLQLRIPTWCNEAIIKVNGIQEKNVKSGTYHTISRVWKKDDTVSIAFPMEIVTTNWVNNSVGVSRGPLVYSLQMNEDWKKINNYEFNGKDYSEYEVYPKNDWNYGLVLNKMKPEKDFLVVKKEMPENPFLPNSTPISLKVKAKKIDSWGLDFNQIHAAEPPVSPVESLNKTDEITLIPFGAERIRVTYFPTIGTKTKVTKTNFTDSFETNEPNYWVNFGGSWQQKDGKYYSQSADIKGVKSVATATNFSDLKYEVFITIVDSNSEGGVLFRVNEPTNGPDNYKGYYAAINTSGKLLIGKSNNSWNLLKEISLPIEKNKKYHLMIHAVGSKIEIFLDNMATPKITVTDNEFKEGAIGLRGYGGKTLIFEKLNATLN